MVASTSWMRCARRSVGACCISSTGWIASGRRASPEPRSAWPTRSRRCSADGHHALVFAVLGHKADLGVMAYGPDLARLHAFQTELAATPLAPTWSFVSLTERSEYTTTADDERARLEAEGVVARRGRSGRRRVRRTHGALRRSAVAPEASAEGGHRLLSDVEAPRRGRQLVRAAVRGAQAADGWSREGRAHSTRAGCCSSSPARPVSTTGSGA